MADLLTRTGTLAGWAGRFAALPDSVSILSEPFHAMVDVRGQTELAPNSWVQGDQVDAVWLGPDETLLTSPFRSPAELAAETGGTDVSAQRTTIRLRGAHARDVLETGCAIDLHPRSFGVGSAAVTMLGQANVVLLCLGENDYRILVRSSFAAYLAEWLIDAACEYT
ncbi:sarcosine oxidase subunit gamma [Pseudonocardia pini]|uniref:sarcosine oxidase subunit gamma n=1 Tax=Pseudonocardia pini TaxID=2758030 RepID=UPI0015F06E4E|nr:sarcosine oxidase subunit gamma family protein [Pseudonocardia pini]